MRQLAILALMCLAASSAFAADGLRVSVAAYMAEPQFAAYEKVVLARAEELLGDSQYVVLDEAKARQLKKGWVDLADPGHVITAEEFIKRAGKYDIQKVVRVGVSVSVKPVLGLFYTATATAELRIVDKAAQATLVGDVFDDAATGQGLLNFFVRGLSAGALTLDEARETGLSVDELQGRSFVKILEARRGR